MHQRTFIALAFIALCFGPCALDARAQSDSPGAEAGVHFTALRFEERGAGCVTAPCPDSVVASSGLTEPGVGARLGYNINRHVAVEAELNLFPRDREFEGGRKLQGLFGVKAGRRYESVGVFAKARPGFLRSGGHDFTRRQGFVCPAIFPTPIECFESSPRSNTDFALDLGGVVELYPSRRVLVRFDLGDTLVFHDGDGDVAVRVPAGGGSRLGVAPARSETTHNLQGSVGIGFRF